MKQPRLRTPLVIAMAAFAAGCSTTQWVTDYDVLRDSPREYFNLVTPTIFTDARVDGGLVTLKRGEAVVVRLDEDPMQGERWQMQPIPASTISAPVQHDFVTRLGSDPTAPGPGDAVFRFRGIAPGTQAVVLEYKRPFEAVASKTIRFDLVVR